jgi:hypothetical protein
MATMEDEESVTMLFAAIYVPVICFVVILQCTL